MLVPFSPLYSSACPMDTETFLGSECEQSLASHSWPSKVILGLIFPDSTNTGTDSIFGTTWVYVVYNGSWISLRKMLLFLGLIIVV